MRINKLTFVSILCIGIVVGCSEGNVTPQGKVNRKSYYATKDDYIYTLDVDDLVVYRMTSGGGIDFVKRITFSNYYAYNNNVSSSIEVSGTRLYIDDSIYDISTPEDPVLLSSGGSTALCQPVVDHGDFTYTMSQVNNPCGNTGLDQIVVTQKLSGSLSAPVDLIKLATPSAMALDNNRLFVICGDNGLFVYDVSDPSDNKLLKSFPEVVGTTIFVDSAVTIIQNGNALEQYNFTTLDSAQMLSIIPIL